MFHLRGGSFTLLVLRLDDAKDPVLFQALRDKVMQAPNFSAMLRWSLICRTCAMLHHSTWQSSAAASVSIS
ncbi:MAG: hypothetical protein HWD60_04175 [Defluviicoccus sp.]|nr:MAG: hypothetical protein HWD60_04175 [Defluviicoccus sp.]